MKKICLFIAFIILCAGCSGVKTDSTKSADNQSGKTYDAYVESITKDWVHADEKSGLTKEAKMFISLVAGEAIWLDETYWKAVANSIMNRTESRNMSVIDVITQKNADGSYQYDSYEKFEYDLCMKYLNNRDGGNDIYEALIAAVVSIYNHEEEDITSGVDYYYSPEKSREIQEKVDNTDPEILGAPIYKEKNYEIYRTVEKDVPMYPYIIFDNRHNVLFEGCVTGAEPEIKKIGNIIEVHIGYGTEAYLCRYYDADKGIASEWFNTPYGESGSLIIDFSRENNNTLIVRDIFDKQKYYKEFERDFSYGCLPILSAEFINGGKQLRITYLTGDDKKKVTETLDLN